MRTRRRASAAAPMPAACASSPVTRLGRRGRRRARVLDRPHRLPDADGRARGRDPEARCAQCRAPAALDAARAIMTTDTVPKEAVARPRARSRSAEWPRARRCSRRRWPRCSRCARPTPAVDHATLQRALATAVGETFDCLIVDGCRSTNDTVLVLANGRAGEIDPHTRSPTRSPRSAVRSREQMARDAEGATKFVRVHVVGARSQAEARVAARAVANSQLVQCSLNGDDPYWGRVLSELGASGARDRPRTGRDRVQRRHGVSRRHRGRARRRPRSPRSWPARDIEILCDLGLAHGDGDGAHHRPVARVHRREPDAPRDLASKSACRDAGVKAHDPRRGAAVHPGVLGQDRRDQVRRPRDGEPRARRSVRDRCRADAARRHEPGRRARRRPADHRPDAPARQGAGVRRRPARHRRRDGRHRAHGARRQGEPRDRRERESSRFLRRRALGRGRGSDPRRPARSAARLRRRRPRDRPHDRVPPAARGADSGHRDGRRRRRRPGVQRQRRHGRGRDRRSASTRRSSSTSPTSRACTATGPTRGR